ILHSSSTPRRVRRKPLGRHIVTISAVQPIHNSLPAWSMQIRARAASALATVATLSLAAGCRPPEADPRLVSEWTHALYGAVRVERLSPPVASRLLAYAMTGLYSGMAAANPSLPSLDGKLNGLASLPRGEAGARYDAALTAIAAERVILDS